MALLVNEGAPLYLAMLLWRADVASMKVQSGCDNVSYGFCDPSRRMQPGVNHILHM